MMDLPHDFLLDYSETIDVRRLGDTNWEIPILPPMDHGALSLSAWRNCPSFEKNDLSWIVTTNVTQESTFPNQLSTDPFVHIIDWNSDMDLSLPSEPSSIGCIVNNAAPAAFLSPMGNSTSMEYIPLQSSSSASLDYLSGSPFKSSCSMRDCSDDSVCSEVTGPSGVGLLDGMMNTMFDARGLLEFCDNDQASMMLDNTFGSESLEKSPGWFEHGAGFDDNEHLNMKEQESDKELCAMNRLVSKTSSQDVKVDVLWDQAADVSAQYQNTLLPDLVTSETQTGFTVGKTVKHCFNHVSLMEHDSSYFTNSHVQADSFKIVNRTSKDEVFAVNHPEPDSAKVEKPRINSFIGAGAETSYTESSIVHLVITAAEAVVASNGDLASVILARLNELISCSTSSMQRVAAYFSVGLQHRISGVQTPDLTGRNFTQSEILSAFQILHEISPYIKFGHFTANQAILEAVEGEKQVHIVDFEIMEGIQWPPLMQVLASRKGGAPRLHITALCRSSEGYDWTSTQGTCKRLSEFATCIGLPFTFSLMKVSEEEGFNAAALKVMKGEAVVGNCMVHLPHMPYRKASSVISFFRGVRAESPIIMTLVEEELGSGSTSHYLCGALHHYSAVFDCLDSCLPGEVVVRTLVESMFFGPRIRSMVACLNGGQSLPYGGLARRLSSVSSSLSSSSSSSSVCQVESERSMTFSWSSLVRSIGFKSLPLSSSNVSQARLLLGLYQDGFKLEEQSNRLLLGWRSRSVYAASAWS